jgi:hypothetical protein
MDNGESERRQQELSDKEKLQKLLIQQREQIQQDLLCVLDGQPQALTDAACQTVVNGFKILIKDLCWVTLDLNPNKEVLMSSISVPRTKSDVTIDELISFLSGVKAEHGNLYVAYDHDGSGMVISSAEITRESLESDCKPTLILY